MGEQDLDRNEAATAYKLEKARQKGQVGKSPEVVSALVFTVAVCYLYWQGWDGLVALFGREHDLLLHAGRVEASPSMLWHLAAGMVRDAALMLAPFLLAIMLAAVLGNLAQTGPLVSFEPVKPDFGRVDPAKGLRRLFSMRTLFEAARALAKLGLLAFVLYQALKALVPQFFHLSAMPPAGLGRTVLADIAAAGLKIALLLCIIAALDFGYVRLEFARRMRMSRREVKDEHRQREGDPRIRARLRELRRESLARSMAVRKTATADVLLTNPTHYAVALRYEHGAMASPQLVAKGAGALAGAMRAIAARHRVPVVQNPPLARALYRGVGIEQHVPPEMYAQVARILVWVFAMKKARESALRGAAA